MAGTKRATKKVQGTVAVVEPKAPAAVRQVASVQAAPAVEKTRERPKLRVQPDRTAIALRAWEIWQREGCPQGRDVEHWLRAEQELNGEL